MWRLRTNSTNNKCRDASSCSGNTNVCLLRHTQRKVQKKNYSKQLHKKQAICSSSLTALYPPADDESDRVHWCLLELRAFQERLPILLLPLNHVPWDSASRHPSLISACQNSGIISLLIASQNPSFATRIQSLSDYNEKFAIGHVGDRIGID